MADYSVTAASVVLGTGGTSRNGTEGGTLTARQAVYLDATDSKLKAAQANTEAAAAAVGVALHGAADGQPLTYAVGGAVTFNAAFAAGDLVCVSDAAAGGLAPYADLASGDYVTVLGVAASTTSLVISPIISGVTI